MQYLPCFLCSRTLQMRTTKKRKPYFVCDPCGIQLFIRKQAGIEKLEVFLQNAEQIAIPYQKHAESFHELQAILKEIDDVEEQIKNIGFSYLLSTEKSRVRDALLQRKENLLVEIEKFCEKTVGDHFAERKNVTA